MRINISIDIEPDEIPLANEIIATLIGITNNVTVNNREAQLAGPSAVSSGSSTQQPVSTPLPVPQQQATQQRQQQQQPQRQPKQQQPAPPLVPQPQQQQQQQAPLDISCEAFAPLIKQLGDESNHQRVMGEVTRLLQAGGQQGRDAEAVENLSKSFMSAVFDGDLAAYNISVVPYVQALACLPMEGEMRNKVRDKITPPILKFLAARRPLDVNRYDVYAQAEAFATLVQMESLTIQGAVKTITALLKSPEKRVAAITMMGKTAELCYNKLLTELPTQLLADLKAALELCTEPIFEEDLAYIYDAFSWGAKTLTATDTWGGGHQERIFALAVETATRHVISGGRDGQVIAWKEGGQRVGTPQMLQDCFVVSLDIDPRTRTVLVGGAPRKNSNGRNHVAAFDVTAAGLKLEGVLQMPEDTKTLSTIRALPHSGGFVTGRQTLTDTYPLDFWNLGSGSASFQNLKPAITFQGHTGQATCAAPYPGEPQMLLSGGRDGQVLLWDQRAGPQGPVGSFRSDASNKVTCMEVSGSTVIAGGLNKQVCQWDLRMASSQQPVHPRRLVVVDDSVILKMSVGPSGLSQVAVSTFTALYLMDFSTDGNPSIEKGVVAGTPLDGKPADAFYHDIKWEPDLGLLYAAGLSGTIDVYSL